MNTNEPKRSQHHAAVLVPIADWQTVGAIAEAIQEMARGEARTFTVVRNTDGRVTYAVRP